MTLAKADCIEHALEVVIRGSVFPGCYLVYWQHEAVLMTPPDEAAQMNPPAWWKVFTEKDQLSKLSRSECVAHAAEVVKRRSIFTNCYLHYWEHEEIWRKKVEDDPSISVVDEFDLPPFLEEQGPW